MDTFTGNLPPMGVKDFLSGLTLRKSVMVRWCEMENPNPLEVGLRLRAVLRKLGADSVKGMARMTGLPRNILSNWINGYNLPKLGIVRELTLRLPGLTLEWVYYGDDRMMPAVLARELAIFVEAFRQELELWELAPDPVDSAPADAPAPRKQAVRAA